jgi:hypothetical protein
MAISDIKEPLERYFAFIRERNEIYYRKTGGQPWPWTEDEILQDYRFTDIYRERDRTSIHYQKTIRDYYTQAEERVLPATVLYRWFNRMSTCEHFFGEPDFGNKSAFERYIDIIGERDIRILLECLEKIPPPHVTGAFIINGKPGYDKGVGVLLYFHEWCKKPWEEQWTEWLLGNPPTLQDMYIWLRQDCTGLGPFMAAQIVADLKYLQFMQNTAEVLDWWTWAAPGPGSQRGLNAVLGRPMTQKWKEKEWQYEIQCLNLRENDALKDLGPFHCQDTQNHCCEFSKYEKTRLGIGRPRQVYRHV